jgi:hypothetical protein
MSINSSSFQSNALTVDGSTAITSATSNLNNNLTSSINNVSNNITSLYLSSQNYVIPSVQVNNYTVNNVNTLNNDGYTSFTPGSTLYNIPSNGVSWSSDGQSSILLTCSENNIDLSPLIQNNLLGNDAGLLTIKDFSLVNDTYECFYRDANHFTFCKTALFPNYYGNGSGLENDYGSSGFPPYGLPSFAFGVFGVWFQYQFSTAFIATSVIMSVADYTQSPDWVFFFGNNDSSFLTGWSLLGVQRFQYNALSTINNYQLSKPGSYLYYRVVVVSANNTQFSISGIKFATNASVSQGVSFGTNSTANVYLGNTSVSTNIVGSFLQMSTPTNAYISAPRIILGTANNNGIPPKITYMTLTQVLTCTTETGTFSASTTSPIAQFRVPFQSKLLGVRASLNTAGTTPTTLLVYFSSLTNFNTAWGTSYNLLSTNMIISTFNTSTTQSGSTTAVVVANTVPDDNVIGIFVSSAGTSAAGLKVTLYYCAC